ACKAAAARRLTEALRLERECQMACSNRVSVPLETESLSYGRCIRRVHLGRKLCPEMWSPSAGQILLCNLTECSTRSRGRCTPAVLSSRNTFACRLATWHTAARFRSSIDSLSCYARK